MWEDARKRLDKDEEDVLLSALTTDQLRHDILADVLALAISREKECTEKQSKIRWRGKSVVLRDVFSKLTAWVQKFVAVGDTIVQYDPAHTALPWAAIRFFLQVAISDVEIYCGIAQSMEQITNLLVRCAIMESLYAQSRASMTKRFREALLALYTGTLQYLTKVIAYYKQSKVVRKLKSVIMSSEDIQTWISTIRSRDEEVRHLVVLIEAEKSDDITDGVKEILLQQQRYSIKLHGLLGDLQSPINRLETSIERLDDELDMKSRVKILNAISTISYSLHHRTIAKTRLAASGRWLLGKQTFLDWQMNSCSSVLWLHGIPGSGKTNLTSLVIDKLQGNAHIAYFYCMRNPAEPDRAKCAKILASLVRQLASAGRKAPILDPIKKRYEEALEGFEGFEDQSWTSEESTEALIELTKIYPSITFILDALDEVDVQDRRKLMAAFDRIMNESTSLVKFFVSSRDSLDIVLRFIGSPNVYIDASDNSDDIRSFVSQRLDSANILYGKLTKELRGRIQNALISGASGMFRWVDLQIQSLQLLKVAPDINERLGRLPDTLEESYWEIFERIQHSGTNAAGLAMLTFQWLLYAQAPLHVATLVEIASSDDMHKKYTSDEVLDVCTHLVAIDDQSHLRFVHLSVREFLEQSLPKRGVNHCRSDVGNTRIASSCLSYLSHVLNKSSDEGKTRIVADQHSLDAPDRDTVTLAATEAGIHSDNIELAKANATMKGELSFRAYAINYWPVHASRRITLGKAVELDNQVLSFLFDDGSVATTFVRWRQEYQKSMPDHEESQETLKWKPNQDVTDARHNPILLLGVFDLLDLSRISLREETLYVDAFVGAATAGNYRVMQKIRLQGIALGEVVSTETPKAIANGFAEVLSILLDMGGRPQPDSLWSVLSKTDKCGGALIRVLLEKAAPSCTQAIKMKVLVRAVSDDYKECASALTRQGALKEDVAVVRSLAHGLNLATIRLIDYGYDISGRHLAEKRTPLHWAAQRGFAVVVELLLAKGVAVNIYDRDFNMPIHLAAARGHVEIVSALAKHGADLSIKNLCLRTPLHLAYLHNHMQVVVFLENLGAKTEEKDIRGLTPLELASKGHSRAASGPGLSATSFASSGTPAVTASSTVEPLGVQLSDATVGAEALEDIQSAVPIISITATTESEA